MKFLLVCLAILLTLALLVAGAMTLAGAATNLTLAVGITTSQVTITVLAVALVAMGILILVAAAWGFRRGRDSERGTADNDQGHLSDLAAMQRQLDRARKNAPREILPLMLIDPRQLQLPASSAKPVFPVRCTRRARSRSAGIGVAKGMFK